MSDPKSDEELRRERAAMLRRQVDDAVNAKDDGSDEESEVESEPPAVESPRDFIHRRMREEGEEPA